MGESATGLPMVCWSLGLVTMQRVALAVAKALLSALLDAVEAGEEVVITRRGHPVARLVRESDKPSEPRDWVERLRHFHAGEPPLPGSAVHWVRDMREEER